MSQLSVRRTENWKFAHAAEAMGAYWARARKIEARRRQTERRARLVGTSLPTLDAAPSPASASDTAKLGGR